jgi:hypothetical protein
MALKMMSIDELLTNSASCQTGCHCEMREFNVELVVVLEEQIDPTNPDLSYFHARDSRFSLIVLA